MIPIAASDVAVAARESQPQREQQRHDHDAASDPEQRTEEARHEADEDEPHAPILAAWI
mgnify:CR=1 FL=1